MADHVIKTWNQIKAISNYELVAGEILFRKIFELAPGAQDMYAFGGYCEQNSDEMYESKEFKLHARAVFGMLDAAVRLVQLGETVALADTLVDLGKKHYKYGVKAAHYPIVGKALIYTLKAALKDDYTPFAHLGWTQVYAAVFSGMSEGAYYEEFKDG